MNSTGARQSATLPVADALKAVSASLGSAPGAVRYGRKVSQPWTPAPINPGGEFVRQLRQSERSHQAAVARAVDTDARRIDVASPLEVGDSARDVPDLAAPAFGEIDRLAPVAAIAGAAAKIHGQHDVALGRQKLVHRVHARIRAHRMPPEQHLARRPAVEEKDRRASTRRRGRGHEELAVYRRFVRCFEHDALRDDEARAREIRRAGPRRYRGHCRRGPRPESSGFEQWRAARTGCRPRRPPVDPRCWRRWSACARLPRLPRPAKGDDGRRRRRSTRRQRRGHRRRDRRRRPPRRPASTPPRGRRLPVPNTGGSTRSSPTGRRGGRRRSSAARRRP